MGCEKAVRGCFGTDNMSTPLAVAISAWIFEAIKASICV